MTVRVNRKNAFAVLITRPSIYGNPFVIGVDGDRDEVISKFKTYFYRRIQNDPEFEAAVRKLKDKKIACACKEADNCHGDVYIEYLDAN